MALNKINRRVLRKFKVANPNTREKMRTILKEQLINLNELYNEMLAYDE